MRRDEDDLANAGAMRREEIEVRVSDGERVPRLDAEAREGGREDRRVRLRRAVVARQDEVERQGVPAEHRVSAGARVVGDESATNAVGMQERDEFLCSREEAAGFGAARLGLDQ